MRALAIISLLPLAACGGASIPDAARGFDDAAVQRLYQMPVPEYYANLRLARVLAERCNRYAFDTRLDLDINQRRNTVGRGSFSALRQRDAIDAMTDVRKREFQAKHGFAVDAGDPCAAADRETAEQTALSAVLVAG